MESILEFGERLKRVTAKELHKAEQAEEWLKVERTNEELAEVIEVWLMFCIYNKILSKCLESAEGRNATRMIHVMYEQSHMQYIRDNQAQISYRILRQVVWAAKEVDFGGLDNTIQRVSEENFDCRCASFLRLMWNRTTNKFDPTCLAIWDDRQFQAFQELTQDPALYFSTLVQDILQYVLLPYYLT